MRPYLIFTLALTLIAPTLTLAQGYVPLVTIPFAPTGGTDIGGYINAIYLIAISVGAFLAVIQIIFGGVKYMLSDVVTDKGDAKKTIRGAIVGLLIIIGAVLALNTINPQLTNLDVFGSIDENELPHINAASERFDGGGPRDCDDTTEELVCTTERCFCRSLSTGEIEDGILDDLEEEAVEDGDFSEVVTVAGFSMGGFNSQPLADRQTYLDDWAEACEVDGAGNDTGNEFTQVGGDTVGALRYLCVRP